MKIKFLLLWVYLLLIANEVKSQITTDTYSSNWSKIENATLVSIVNNDADNGDGLNDGAVLIKGTANTPALQGVQYLLSGTPFSAEQINLEAKYYQNASSYVRLKMQIYNATDSVILTETAVATTSSGVVGTFTLSYSFPASSAGDQIMVRIVRADDLNPVRASALDYLKVNGVFVNMIPECKPIFSFDLPLSTATTTEIHDLSAIRNSLSDQILGTSAPTAAQLNSAITQYNALNIIVNGSNITGSPITNVAQIGFLKTFARYLKFNPADTSISNKATKAVWYAAKQNCNGTNGALTFYNYPTFSRAAIFLNNYLPDNVKALFGNTLYTETDLFKYLFDPNYDFNTTQTNGSISTDIMYLDLDVLFAYADWFNTNDEKVRYLKTVKRYLERFLIHTAGTKDGLKIDGLGFHHSASYDGYMYAYGTVATTIKSLEGTTFQIDQPSYLRFRDAVYAQTMYSNDAGVKPFAMAGRNPQSKTSTLGSGTLANLAISGGKILGLGTADPVLAGIYNRKYNIKGEFNYSLVAPFEEGYIQFNYANLGIYRKDGWVASMKGQSDKLWGSEIYKNQNRYGRYQSYGALEIIYPGSSATGSGYSEIGWDWNYNPGATTIVLPWEKLQAEKERVDEYNTYGFAGSLALNQANQSFLSETIGQSGLFAMKFKERTNLGFGAVYGPTTHNGTFEFTKSYFAIDNYIICLANGIKNDDIVNPTVTTLFQRLDNNSTDIFVNGELKTNESAASFSETSPNWIIDNYNTGYYILPNSGTLKIKNSLQTTPYQNQVSPSAATIASNSSNNYHLAYLDHGTTPASNSYEFVCMPSANMTKMNSFAQQMQSAQDKPYVVHQNNLNQQIIEHKASKTWAYVLPAVNDTINNGLIKSNDTPCLVMYKGLNEDSSEIVLSVSNPDMGATPSTAKVITLTLNDKWNLSQANSNANVTSTTSTTTISFTVADGLPVEIKLVAAKQSVVCPPMQVTIPDVYAINAADNNKNTIYIGYGPTSLTLNAMVQGGQNYTYSWSTGAQTPSISVSQAGTYTVTVSCTDGCQSEASITIKAVDVRCGDKGDKVAICHKGSVICVSKAAVQAHLNKGDQLGFCNGSANQEIVDVTDVKLYPNPVQENLNVTVSKLEKNASISIYNISGVRVRNVNFINLPQEVSVGNLPRGTYYVVIQNGKETFKRTIFKE